ncbi:MAG TPA: ABC transporter ATP-binding protein [Candidatus Saccharimonadales bacterium]|nr:ABC transporter ATP-binding protein [Candidatus Saccharimonadales bacterium]
MKSLLTIENFTVKYTTSSGTVTALDNVSLDVRPNELLAIVGESGCGKSTLGLSIIGLLPRDTANVTGGSVSYKGTDLVKLDSNKIREYRGTEIAMIFQEPLTSLSPVYKVGDQIAEAIMIRELRKKGHKVDSDVMQKVYTKQTPKISRMPRMSRKISSELREQVIEYLKLVRIGDADQVIDRYPFELSGGMTQRVMIAMALSQEPALLIADEPTTALDVTTQAQVLKLMKELMEKVETSILLVTHDLAVASQVADRVIVMYAGEIAENADVYNLFAKPLHPYTNGLLACVPKGYKDTEELTPISGSLPDLRNPPTGCRYAPRCPRVMDVCTANRPRLTSREENRSVSCFLYE